MEFTASGDTGRIHLYVGDGMKYGSFLGGANAGPATLSETVLVNSGTRTSFLIDGDAPILRERDTITAETANTPAKRLYLCLQTMYLKNDIPRYRTAYQGFLRELREANPGARITIDAANAHVAAGALYKALKEIRKLVKREDELLAA